MCIVHDNVPLLNAFLDKCTTASSSSSYSKACACTNKQNVLAFPHTLKNLLRISYECCTPDGNEKFKNSKDWIKLPNMMTNVVLNKMVIQVYCYAVV